MKQDKNNNQTSVWLDLSSCSLPRDCDLSRVRPSIESALKTIVGSGPVTSFFAFGDMKELPPSVIEGMISSGISMRHSLFALRDIMFEIRIWKRRNPPPANLLLISRDYLPGHLALTILDGLSRKYEYNLIRGLSSDLNVVLQNSLLEQQETSQETRPYWQMRTTHCCEVCKIPFSNLSDFLQHVQGHSSFQEEDARPSTPNPIPIPWYFNQDYKYNNPTPTSVWLDMSSCSLPRGYDARRVRPSIESALKTSVDSFFAYGDMKKLSPSVIKGMSSSGISIVHSHFPLSDIMVGIHIWKHRNPPPANVMLISLDYRVAVMSPYLPLVPLDAMYPRDKEFNVIRAFPSLLAPKEFYWDTMLKTFILEEEETSLQETRPDSTALSLDCLLCKIPFTNLSDFLQHLQCSEEHSFQEEALHSTPIPKVVPWYFKQVYKLPSPNFAEEYKKLPDKPAKSRSILVMPGEVCKFKAKPNNNQTAVWWDMNTCPLPECYDPRCVRLTIEEALKKSIGSGHVAIFACGNIKKFHEDFILDMASSGISIIHSLDFNHLFRDMNSWKRRNPPPGNIMLISNDPAAQGLSPFLPYYPGRRDQHYDVLQGYKANVQFHSEFLWDSLMKRMPVQEEIPTSGTNLCTKTASVHWLCVLCGIHDPSTTFEDLYTHLKCDEHARKENLWLNVNEDKRRGRM